MRVVQKGELPITEWEKIVKNISTTLLSSLFLGIAGILGVIFSAFYIRYTAKIRLRTRLKNDVDWNLNYYNNAYEALTNPTDPAKSDKYRRVRGRISLSDELKKLSGKVNTTKMELEYFYSLGDIDRLTYSKAKDQFDTLIEEIKKK
jgi:hypothetical protein